MPTQDLSPQAVEACSLLDELYDLPVSVPSTSGEVGSSGCVRVPDAHHGGVLASKDGEPYEDSLTPVVEVEKRKVGRPEGGKLDRSDPNFYESTTMKIHRVSREQGADAVQEMLNTPGMLHNPTLPLYIRTHEQAHHRLFIYLKAQGLSNKEIAERTEYNVATVNDVLKQPWARTLLVEELRIAGRDALQGLIASKYEDAVCTLVEVMEDKKQPGNTRVTAANSILNRGLGNPTQPLAVSNLTDLKSLADEELIAQLQGIVKNGGGPN